MEQLNLPAGKTKEQVDWVTVYQAAQIMGCTRQNIQKHQNNGRFRVYWKDERGRLQLSRAEVRDFSRRVITRGQKRRGRRGRREIAGQRVLVK